MGKKFVIISDLHVGSGRLDGFDLELETAFLDFLGSKTGGPEPTEMIINGDFLEFIQAEPYLVSEPESISSGGIPLCHTQETSTSKLSNIIATHPKLFDGLADSLCSHKENRIIILPGNHDVDLFWEDVQDVLRTRIAGQESSRRERVVFILDRHYSPSEMPDLWIEHGHMYDPANWFKVKEKYTWGERDRPILPDKTGQERVIECPGTKLLLRYLNRIMENDDYHNIKYINPVYLFLFWGASLLEEGQGPEKFRASVAQMFRQLIHTEGFSPAEVLQAQSSINSIDIVGDIVSRITYKGEKDLRERIHLNQPLKSYVKNPENADRLLEMLALEPDLLDNIELVVPESSASLARSLAKEALIIPDWITRFFKMSNEDMLTRHAVDLVSSGTVRYVVMGHTHKVIEDHDRGYYNPGCLTRKFSAEYATNGAKWDYLKKEQLTKFPYRFHYVEVDISTNPQISVKVLSPR